MLLRSPQPLAIKATDDLEYYFFADVYALLRDGHISVLLPFSLLEGRSVPKGIDRILIKVLEILMVKTVLFTTGV